MASHPRAALVCTEGKQSLYRRDADGRRRKCRMPAARRCAIAVIRPNVNEAAVTSMIDQDRTTRWESGPQTDRTAVEIDLGGVRTVARHRSLPRPVRRRFSARVDHRSVGRWAVVARSLAGRQRRAGVRRGVRSASRRAAALPVCADAGAVAANEADEERRHVLLVDRGNASAWGRNMGEPDTTDKRSTNPLGIIVALGALGSAARAVVLSIRARAPTCRRTRDRWRWRS